MKTASLSLFTVLCSTSNAIPLQNRAKDKISSCGSDWMQIDDIKTNHDQIQRRGFNSAVDFFCDEAHDQTLGAGLYLSLATRVYINYGKDPKYYGINGYVYFEVYNKMNKGHVIDGAKCKGYLKELSKKDGKCYGSDNKDTKGGTWQVGDEDISYHAKAERTPPNFDSVDKTVVLKEAIKPLDESYRVPVPFPYYSFNDIVPIGCHIHNDYEKAQKPLYDAISAGCVSAEVDVWHRDGKLRVGHTSPGKATIQDMYINPLKALLEGTGSVFPKSPDQDFTLLVDIKSSNEMDKTWDTFVESLKPLREKGWLSYYKDGKFQKGKITVVASGNAPFDKINSNKDPERAIFFDATVQDSLDGRDKSNTYLASGDFGAAVGGSGTIKDSHLEKLKKQVKAAHDKGFRVRYWDGPDEDQWQQMIDECVDRINTDHPEKMPALDFKLNGGGCSL
ncbi:hypothetical protein CC78DRAFT_564830 [Lojkania enalia]|uniref:Altered inheritance of mitochondria protein 6 n=1 Tax=Lojkania enalia TaxID=147567 RepID=A0A9P4N9G2_9PLEO|nr:hypothetical protein CC78DRAFT_564830 [Didymosphaeria enalia]